MVNVLDIVFIVIGSFFLIRGVFRGLVKEVISTGGVLLAYYLASNHNEFMVSFFQTWFSDPGVLHFLSFLGVFWGVMLGVWVLGWLIIRTLRLVLTPLVDVPGGALVGLVKAALICSVVLVGLNSFLPDLDTVKQSRIAPYLQKATDVMAKFSPDTMKNFDPSSLLEEMAREKDEAMKRFLEGGSGDDSSDDGESNEMLKKMGEAIKNLNKDKK